MKKAKYKIGQKVWIIPDCSEKIICTKITKINYVKTDKYEFIEYEVKNFNEILDEINVHSTKAYAKKELKILKLCTKIHNIENEFNEKYVYFSKFMKVKDILSFNISIHSIDKGEKFTASLCDLKGKFTQGAIKNLLDEIVLYYKNEYNKIQKKINIMQNEVKKLEKELKEE